MFKNNRHNEILEILKKRGWATVNELSETLYASKPTIRRDLTKLENDGYLRRSHGGAVLNDDKLHNNPVGYRRSEKMHEKLLLCKLASTLVGEGNLIFIDDSTTVYHLADFIKDIENVTVVTNGLSVCKRLSENNVKTISTGGRLAKSSEAFVGYFAEQTVSGFNADIMFFSAAAIDEEGVISDYSEAETSLRIAMKKRSARTALLCLSDKLNTKSELRLFSTNELDYIVTDKPLSDAFLQNCNMTETARAEGAILYKRVASRH